MIRTPWRKTSSIRRLGVDGREEHTIWRIGSFCVERVRNGVYNTGEACGGFPLVGLPRTKWIATIERETFLL
jgi:hypothetical protein